MHPHITMLGPSRWLWAAWFKPSLITTQEHLSNTTKSPLLQAPVWPPPSPLSFNELRWKSERASAFVIAVLQMYCFTEEFLRLSEQSSMTGLITHCSLHVWLRSLVWQRGKTAQRYVHEVWRTFWNRNSHPGTCLLGSDSNIFPDIRSTCSGHHSPTKVVNHVLQCGDNKLSWNKTISMLMTRQPPEETNSHNFSVLLPKMNF